MSALVVYGSLMAKAQILSLGQQLEATHTVHVQGFRREFSQEPAWRVGIGQQRAVLNVVPTEEAVTAIGGGFNGILLRALTDKMLSDLDHRERGYHRVEIPTAWLSSFDQEHELEDNGEPVFTYVGKAEMRNGYLLPNPAYLKRCVLAARDWGDRFYQTFCQNTYIQDRTLIEHSVTSILQS